MRGFGGSTLRGGQTVFHSIRMWGQLFQAAMLFAAFMTVAVPAWNLWNRTTGAEWYAAGMFTLAEFKLTVGYAPDSGQEIRFADGTAGRDEDPRHRGLDAGLAGARAHQGGDVPERLARRQGRRRHHRPVPRLVLVPGRAALAPQAHPGRRAGDGGRIAPPGAALAHLRVLDRAPGARASGPTALPASRIRSAPRPSTPSSRAPPDRARPC